MSPLRCHTKEKLKKFRTDTAVISGGCIKLIQAPDVYWNAPFKAKVRSFYWNRMLHGEKSYAKSGNMRAPSMEVYLKWIVDAWDQLLNDLTIKSFKGCELTNTVGGSEDCKIHCFRSDGSIPTKQELLQQAWANADITGKRKLIQQLDVDAEDVENDENGNNSDVSLDFYK